MLWVVGNADAAAIIKKHVNDADETVKQHAAEALTAASAAAAAPEPAANVELQPKHREGPGTSKSAEALELAQIKKWNDETDIRNSLLCSAIQARWCAPPQPTNSESSITEAQR